MHREGWTTFPSTYTPIHFNPAFPPAMNEGPFDSWREGGCLKLSDLFHNFDISTFESCKREFQVTQREHYHYLQLKHWATLPHVKEAATRELTAMERLAHKAGNMNGATSLYNMLLNTLHAPPPRARYMSFWEQVLGREIKDKE